MAESFANDLLQAAFVRIVLVTSEYFTTIVDALHVSVTKVSHEGGRLLMSNIAFNSSSIVIPLPKVWECLLWARLSLKHRVFVPEHFSTGVVKGWM